MAVFFGSVWARLERVFKRTHKKVCMAVIDFDPILAKILTEFPQILAI